VGTAAARRASNVDELISLGEHFGFFMEVISTEVEARLSRQGALFRLPLENSSTVVLDIGGASTEISTAHDSFSMPIGSVSLTEEFLKNNPPSEQDILFLKQKIKREIDLIPFFISNRHTLVATAGTPTTLASLENKTADVHELHGMKISKKTALDWEKYLWTISSDDRKNIKGMPFYRADVMPAGLSILNQIIDRFQWNECVVSTTGLRYGLLCQILNNSPMV